ncbi:uncharacterized protein TRFO_28634 [Tritrichomonas foetus]|uniref:DUF4419 domain-containing protein n=1 Tax=Tritrichomonas foetus TaxID=1144522 RepID=A0A1J4JZR3_9EUKA|nr:uncharacterized protein TRFO_28634 [Tritrichomonas foetus]|eukprot:OHT03976.1 uncharacterized protein TRFO_28634 [Tritrichomonas foetus]
MNPETITLELEYLTPPRGPLPITKTEEINEMYPGFICSSNNNDLVCFGDHPVLQGFVEAYIEHRPITISPDIIWLLIIQGFSYHIEFNAEQLRSKFVNFEGKKKLTVSQVLFDFREKDKWEKIFPLFVDQIQNYTGYNLINTLTPNFTTTTKTSLAVGQVSIMAAMKHYFKYELEVYGCGLPSVTIEGSKEDWIKIKEKLSFLEQFDLEWWISQLHPIIQEIINAKDGKINKEFWLHMIKYKDGDGYYNPSQIDGWFVSFFPYNKHGDRMSLKRIFADDPMPKEMLQTPFVLKFYIGDIFSQVYDCTMHAGFIGLKQDPETFNLKPEIGWVIEQDTNKKQSSIKNLIPEIEKLLIELNDNNQDLLSNQRKGFPPLCQTASQAKSKKILNRFSRNPNIAQVSINRRKRSTLIVQRIIRIHQYKHKKT